MKMKKKYVLTLVVIGIMLVMTLVIGTGYGLYLSINNKDTLSATTLDCFKVYYSNSDVIEFKNVQSVTNETGLETSPYTLTITNICNDDKELQVRLNILDETTVDTKSLTIQATGNIEQNTILYKNLNTTKTLDQKVKDSKLIGLVTIKPNETIRTNIKVWFDEKKAPTIPKGQTLKAKFELIDTASAIKAPFAEILLNQKANILEKASPSFANLATTDEGLYAIVNNDSKSYYYRGVVNNNYVLFANFLWRIVGINSDQSVKLILDKAATYQEYNDAFNEKDYVGLYYMWGVDSTSSKINNYLQEWYKIYILDKQLDKYVTTSSFCNDTSYFINNYHTYFNGYARLVNSKEPSLICQEPTADFGGTYQQKIGLITADEVALAGGVFDQDNLNYYLANGESFFTMTGAEYYQYNAYIFSVNNNGRLQISKVNDQLGIRPVISLDKEVTVSGSGTINNPYTIDLK